MRLAIYGAAGRMGRRLVALSGEDEQLELVTAIEAPGHPLLGQSASALAGESVDRSSPAISDKLKEQVEVLIDFSNPAGTRVALQWCRKLQTAMVIGTTGLTDADHETIDQASAEIAVLQAPNMSMGVNLLLNLAATAAGRLGDDYDIEITETHHRYKKDAPSGTALALARAVCDATGRTDDNLAFDRHGPDVPRKPRQIGMHALRSGDVVGRHTVSFATLGEELQLTHVATNRDIFARGALRAAKWLAGRKPGRYHMADVLGLDRP